MSVLAKVAADWTKQECLDQIARLAKGAREMHELHNHWVEECHRKFGDGSDEPQRFMPLGYESYEE